MLAGVNSAANPAIASTMTGMPQSSRPDWIT